MEIREEKILRYLENHKEEITEDLLCLVRAQSPSHHKPACDRCAGEIARLFTDRVGAGVTFFPQKEDGDQILLTIPGEDPEKKPVLVLCHYDTVWDIDALPIVREGDKLYGPGVFDMKGGIVLTLWAIRALQQTGSPLPGPVWVFCNSDEEIGSHVSKDKILELGGKSRAVLVAEPAEAVTGRLKTTRKGGAHYHIHIQGKAAHAGNDPKGGISAVEEMARQILALHAMTDLSVGTSVNVGVVSGGTRANIIADQAEMEIDVRYLTAAEGDRVEEKILALQPQLPGAKLAITGQRGMPPLEDTPENRALFEKARQAAQALDQQVEGSCVGGCSDGNLTSALGIPTLDGLGATGEGLHARHEHLYLNEYPNRIALFALLLLRV